MRKVEPIESSRLSSFDRLLPSEGTTIYPGVNYRDVNDISANVRRGVKQVFRYDSVYQKLHNQGYSISKGSKIGRRYCLYATSVKDEDIIGTIILTEYLDNPDGYGRDDFWYNKWIFPRYRQQHESRCVSGDTMHMMSLSGVANHLYCYPYSKSRNNFALFRHDRSLPCASPIYDSDGPEIQSYIIVRKEFDTIYGPRFLMEMNCEMYRTMDRVAYMKTGSRSLERVLTALRDMDQAAELVKKTVGG